jgi:hypothetical protein
MVDAGVGGGVEIEDAKDIRFERLDLVSRVLFRLP